VGRDFPPELTLTLLPMYEPCAGFAGTCAGAVRWDPAAGHIPRGCRGAEGGIEDVQLILVTAEPGDPYGHEAHPANLEPIDFLRRTAADGRSFLASPQDTFNRNIRLILDLAWPGLSFDQQMRRTLVTESVFCSASEEGASVPRHVESACLGRYVAPHLALFSNARIVALGRKAQKRLGREGIPFTAAWAAAPPGANRPEARASWEAAVAGLA
jgi:hypothetical protein